MTKKKNLFERNERTRFRIRLKRSFVFCAITPLFYVMTRRFLNPPSFCSLSRITGKRRRATVYNTKNNRAGMKPRRITASKILSLRLANDRKQNYGLPVHESTAGRPSSRNSRGHRVRVGRLKNTIVARKYRIAHYVML